jgi:prepilin-type N-terminal cleavage/methylation domain-containing protein
MKKQFKVQGSRFKVQSPDCKVQSSRFKVQSPNSKVQGSKFEVQSPEGMWTAKCGVRSCVGFTLIELLVVIGIIVVLAGMLFAALPAIQRVKTTSRLKTELRQVQTAIEAYKAKLGYYPPDNPGNLNPGVNQLYYELLGTRRTNEGGTTYYYTLDGTAKIAETTTAFQNAFGGGTKLTGFMNCTRGTGDDTVRAENFFKGGLRTGQFSANNYFSALGSGIDGPFMIGKVNPWRYNSSSPTNNPGTFDLWIDYDMGGKSNKICNWSDRAL